MTPAAVAVVGGGRVGLSLARALAASGAGVTVLARASRPLPAPLADATAAWHEALAASGLVVIAVPDAAIMTVAARLHATGAITSRHAVLHCAGVHDRSALAPLEPTGAALGSFHPLQTFRDPAGDPAVLGAAPVVLEGDPRAIAAGRQLAERLQLPAVHVLPAAGKVLYHAAAAMASNHLVVLADLATRMAREAGLDATASLFAPIMVETVRGLADRDPAAALTGPVRRGEVDTVAAHLRVLQGDVREAYRVLALGAVELAVREGMAPAVAARLRRALRPLD